MADPIGLFSPFGPFSGFSTVNIIAPLVQFIDAASHTIKDLRAQRTPDLASIARLESLDQIRVYLRVRDRLSYHPSSTNSELAGIVTECDDVSNQLKPILGGSIAMTNQCLDQLERKLSSIRARLTLVLVANTTRPLSSLDISTTPKRLRKDALEVLLAAGASIDQSDEEGRTILHIAARRGNLSIAQWALEKGVSINKLDGMNRPPIFGAVEHHHEAMVNFLADRPDFEPNHMDKEGDTLLDVALGHSEHPSMVLLLLQKGCSPTVGVDEDILQLLSAAAAGNTDEVNLLIEAGLDVNSHDRLGYTALHEAACFGRVAVLKRLIQCGADIDARIADGGDTVLHEVIERGRKHRHFFTTAQDRNYIPRLTRHHIEVVRLLLRAGASTRLQRSDGTTIRELVFAELDAEAVSEEEKLILRDIRVTLATPPCVEAKLQDDLEYRRPRADEDKMKVCNYFNLQIRYHTADAFLPREASVGNFIYGHTQQDSGRNVIIELERWVKEQTQNNSVAHQHWRWIHLPANNKAWAKDITSTLHSGSREGNCYLKKIHRFIEDSYHEFRGAAPHARLRRALFTPLFGHDQKPFSLVIPYFDTESLEDYLNRKHLDHAHYHKKRELERVYRPSGTTPGDLHVPCTLDQSYYLSLRDSSERDRTQVVVKHAEFKENMNMDESPEPDNLIAKQCETMSKPKKLLMVNQIWLWKTNSNTFITAFPDRWHQSRNADLLTHITQNISGDLPPTLNSMIIQILHHTIGFVDAPRNAGLDENIFDIFEQSIAHRAHSEAKCYEEFYRAQNHSQNSGIYGPTARETLLQRIEEEKICDITREIEHLREIKDIRDELKMIERVLVDQRTVLTQYRADHKDSTPEEDNRFASLTQNLDFRILKVERLAKDALSVEDSLNHLLDLKQKQGNLNEARDTRRLTNEADARARAGQTQNSLLFVFTIITVVFTPMSFVSTFLAVPSRDYPQNAAGSAVSWRWWHIFVGALVTEVITFIAIALFWVRGRPRHGGNFQSEEKRMPVLGKRRDTGDSRVKSRAKIPDPEIAFCFQEK